MDLKILALLNNQQQAFSCLIEKDGNGKTQKQQIKPYTHPRKSVTVRKSRMSE